MIYYQLCGNIVLNSLANTAAYPLAVSNKAGVINIDMPDYFKETNIGAFSLDPEVRMNQYECHTVGNKELERVFISAKKYPMTSVLQLAQMNRNIESPERINNPLSHYPMRSDISSADALFQASDYVIVIHRPELS